MVNDFPKSVYLRFSLAFSSSFSLSALTWVSISSLSNRIEELTIPTLTIFGPPLLLARRRRKFTFAFVQVIPYFPLRETKISREKDGLTCGHLESSFCLLSSDL